MARTDIAAAAPEIADFARVFRNHPAGVAVITADSPSGPVALTATSLISISAAPPVAAFAVSDLSSTAPAIRAARTLVIHMLAVEHRGLAVLGATHGADRFAGVAWSRLPTGEPRYDDVPVWMRGEVLNVMPVPGSTLIVAQLLQIAHDGAEHSPLVYHDRAWHGISERSLLER